MGAWIITLAILAVTDIVFGIAHAYITCRLNSTIARHGMIRKAAMFILVGVTYWVNTPLKKYVTFNIAELTVAFFCVSEFLSVLRYAVLLGVPVPKRVRDALEEVQHSLNGGDDDDRSARGGGSGGFYLVLFAYLLRPFGDLARYL